MANVPKPVTRQDRYYDYLINGGDINKLPQPIDRIDKYLYYLCVNGFGGGGTVTPEQIDAAVERYLEENPISYENLGGKPTINGVELSGDLTLEDIGITDAGSDDNIDFGDFF